MKRIYKKERVREKEISLRLRRAPAKAVRKSGWIMFPNQRHFRPGCGREGTLRPEMPCLPTEISDRQRSVAIAGKEKEKEKENEKDNERESIERKSGGSAAHPPRRTERANG